MGVVYRCMCLSPHLKTLNLLNAFVVEVQHIIQFWAAYVLFVLLANFSQHFWGEFHCWLGLPAQATRGNL